MPYKNLVRGEIGLIRNNPLKMGLQTCIGTIIYGNNLVGAAHGLIPKGIGSNYDNPLIIIPTGIEKLASLIKSKGAKKEELKALLFGGKIDSSRIGVKNAKQARETLERLRIPLKMDFTKKIYWDTNLKIYQDKFEVKAPNFPSVFSKKFNELK